MKLVKLGIYYDKYLDWFYKTHPTLAAEDYWRQHAALMADCFGSSDFWTVALSKLGYDATEIVANARPLQVGWAEERKVAFDPARWLFDISAAQICASAPDVLIVADYSTFTADYIKTLRERCPSIRLVAGWCGAPYQDPSVFREWDLVLSCVPELVDEFRRQGHVSRHLHHSFDPRVLARIDLNASPNSNFSFIGSIMRAPRFHNERDAILSSLRETTPLEIWSDAAPTGWEMSQPTAETIRNDQDARPDPRPLRDRPAGLLSGMARRVLELVKAIGGAASLHESKGPAGPRMHSPLFGKAMFQQLRRSRVTLNTHIDVAAQSASNMRLFETTGVGTCLLTDWKPNLHELFDENEVVTYRTTEECAEKAGYLLRNDKVRRRIAAAGQKRTLRDHNVNVRVQNLDAIIREVLAAR